MLSDSDSSELLSFLKPDTRPDVKGYVTGYILGLSAHSDGCRYLCSKPDLLVSMVTLMSDPSITIAKNCYHAFINLSADETLHQVLVTQNSELLPLLFRNLLDPGFHLSDQICTILSNLSRSETTCRSVFKVLEEQSMGLAKLLDIFCTDGFNKTASLHHLAPVLSNLAQLPEARHFLLDKDRCAIKRLLPYTLYEASAVRRRGVVGLLHNCCFDYSHHEWLLSDAVDILPFLLLPLAGPEELTDEENEGLPIDLQYLPEDKKREPDPDVRRMLVETLLLLTATTAGRRTLKNTGVYPILRELHGWEAERRVTAVCENIIQVLIGVEPEEGMENLMEVKIPDDVEERLKEADRREEEAIRGGGD